MDRKIYLFHSTQSFNIDKSRMQEGEDGPMAIGKSWALNKCRLIYKKDFRYSEPQPLTTAWLCF